MLDRLRYPTKLTMFGFFTLLQVLLFVPVVIFFSFYNNANIFAVGSIVIINLAVAYVVTLVAMIAFLFLSRGEAASFIVPLSFALFIWVLEFVFSIFWIIQPYNIRPYDWGRYVRFITQGYLAVMIILSTIIATCGIIYRKIKRTSVIDID